ncbi:MAG: TPM domain-containing protein [Acidithiobacillales bacterium]
MARRSTTKDFFDGLDRPAIVEAIRRAEEKGFGEIRVHLHHGRTGDARKAAETTFLRLGMDRTAHRTGCLLFIVPEEKAFAVIGDAAIHEKAGDAFWASARDRAALLFAEGRFTEGIVAAVELIGEVLSRHFPKGAGEADTNELVDEVSED